MTAIKTRITITINELILERIEREIKARGGQTSYSALINEILAEKFDVKEQLAQETKINKRA